MSKISKSKKEKSSTVDFNKTNQKDIKIKKPKPKKAAIKKQNASPQMKEVLKNSSSDDVEQDIFKSAKKQLKKKDIKVETNMNSRNASTDTSGHQPIKKKKKNKIPNVQNSDDGVVMAVKKVNNQGDTLKRSLDTNEIVVKQKKKKKNIEMNGNSNVMEEMNATDSSEVSKSKKKKPKKQKRRLVLAPLSDAEQRTQAKLAQDKAMKASKLKKKTKSKVIAVGQEKVVAVGTKVKLTTEEKVDPLKLQQDNQQLLKKVKKAELRRKRQALKRKEKQRQKVENEPIEKKFDAPPFDEAKFDAIVNLQSIKTIGEALKKLVSDEVKQKKTSIFDDYHYILDVVSFKVPSCPKRMVKLNLKHSLVDRDADDDVLIVVPDLQRGSKVDYEPTIEHYENFFRDAGVTGLKIMSFNQLRTEYKTFEAKRKLAATYDYFLCDGRISGHLVGMCGKIFQKPRTTFHIVRLDDSKNVKNEVEKALRRTAFRQLEKGNLLSIPVASHRHSAQQVAENISFVIEQLKKIHPGGMGNVHGLQLKIDLVGTSSLPLYVSACEPPAQTPYVVGLREKKMTKLKKQANQVLTQFSLTKEGNINKLSKKAIETKRKLKETKLALLAVNAKDDDDDAVGDTDDNDSGNHSDGNELILNDDVVGEKDAGGNKNKGKINIKRSPNKNPATVVQTQEKQNSTSSDNGELRQKKKKKPTKAKK